MAALPNLQHRLAEVAQRQFLVVLLVEALENRPRQMLEELLEDKPAAGVRGLAPEAQLRPVPRELLESQLLLLDRVRPLKLQVEIEPSAHNKKLVGGEEENKSNGKSNQKGQPDRR